MHLSTVSAWLAYIGTIHPYDIELGLARVKTVAARLNLLTPKAKVIIVGGTNGKGSTVFALEAIYRANGYRVGVFTSPILFKHNEEVRINGENAQDDAFCSAFEAIESARDEITLTPFEFHALAALWIFRKHPLDLWLLEVGLGGRLDAVNIIDADLAIITSIELDHTDILGNSREAIAKEKAGIFRKDKPAVCGDKNPPVSLLDYAAQVGAPLYCHGRDFHHEVHDANWSWRWNDLRYPSLPLNSLATQNMSTALMAITHLQKDLPVATSSIQRGLQDLTLPGRQQIIKGDITEIYDVAHNPAAVRLLATMLEKTPCSGKTFAVFSMLADKDIENSMRSIVRCIDEWYIAPLLTKRAASHDILQAACHSAHLSSVHFFATISEAYQAAKQNAQSADRIVVFGSFHTVASVL